ncbi:MAG: hypothetical protein LBJ86_00305 [Spirochaetaceae bacterium]|jgi:hypothetical protein|nr:hypothetical protein [Spirochaetaceae bacterium]
MKLKSFLFLTAALALGLAFASCGGGEDTTTTVTVNRGFASDAEQILAAFEFADHVYLTKETDLEGAGSGNEMPLIVPTGKTLHVNGQTIKVNATTIAIVGGKLDWDNKPASRIEGENAVLVGFPDGAADIAHYAAGTDGVVLVKTDGVLVGSDSVAFVASTATGSLSAANGGGTTAIFIGDYGTTSYIAPTGGGTLLVTGNMTGLPYLNAQGPVYVFGKLSGGTLETAYDKEILSGSAVMAWNAAITSGSISSALTVLNDGSFDKVIFGAALDAKKATFNKDVEFKVKAESITNAVFANGIKASGSAQVGNLAFTGSGNTLVLAASGEIIFTNGTTPAFFNGAGTLAALGGSVSFTVDSNKLTVDGKGAGTFALGNKAITLDGNSIEVKGSTGIYFDGADSIASANYSIGDTAGTLSADKGFILTKDGIEGVSAVAAERPTLTSGTDAVFFTVKGGSLAKIKNANISVASGSIAFGGGSATLFLDAGGSITANASQAGSLAHSGYIVSDWVGGSIVAGSLAGSMSNASILAGSVGTTGQNFISVTSEFVIANNSSSNDDKSGSASTAGSMASYSSTDYTSAGSIAVFAVN